MPGDTQSYRDEHPSRPALVVEVAESSYRIDHAYKAGVYARARVPEYWIVDVARELLEVHRDPQPASAAVHGWCYRSLETLDRSATLTPLVAPVVIPVADLLP